LKIAFLLTQSLESPSGLGRYWPLSKELVRLGHEVTILSLHHNYEDLTDRRFVQSGVDVRYVGQMHVRKLGNLKTYFTTRQLVWVAAVGAYQLTRAALRIDADVYHLGKPHPMNGVAVLIPHFLKGKRVYLDCDDYEAITNQFARGWQRAGVRFFEDRLPKLAAGITTNTRFTAERLRQNGYPKGGIIYVPNGVDRERFRRVDLSAVEDLRDRWQLRNRQVVLYLGSMSLTSHPIDLLLNAFDVVRRTVPAAVLLLVGGGEDFSKLQRETEVAGLRDVVRLVGRVSPDKALDYYALADISVDPVNNDLAAKSRSPLKVVESLAAGVPVITGDVGDRARLLDRGGGILVAAGNSTSLAEGLLQVLTNSSMINELKMQTQYARQAFYWDVLVHDFVRVYDVTT